MNFLSTFKIKKYIFLEFIIPSLNWFKFGSVPRHYLDIIKIKMTGPKQQFEEISPLAYVYAILLLSIGFQL